VAISQKQASLIKFSLRILITLITLVLIFHWVDLRQFKQTLVQADWGMLAVVWLVNTSLFWIRSLRLRLILSKLDCDVSINTLFGSSAAMALYGIFMPGMLSLAAKWYIIKRATGKGSHIISGMLYNQVSIMVIMVAVGLLALMFTNPLEQLQVSPKQIKWVSAGCLLLFLTVLLAFTAVLSQRVGRQFDGVADFALSHMPAFIQHKAGEILRQIRVFRTIRGRFHLLIALLGLVTGAAGGTVVYMSAAKAAHITLPITVFVWLHAIVYILGRIPISVANCGIREFVIIGFLGMYGVERSQALLMSGIIFSAYIFMAFLGALYQISWSLRKKRPS